MYVVLFLSSLNTVPPIIEPFSFQDGLSEGMRTRTVCGVSQGDPPLTITWLKDGGILPPHLGANYTTLDAYSSLLSIPSLTSSHSGDYTCVASNPAAELRYTAKLQVKGTGSWFNVEPFLFDYPSTCQMSLVSVALALRECGVTRYCIVTFDALIFFLIILVLFS